MKGDFSTVRFDSRKHYNRVLKQQGRVELDSDWNEQAAISQHLLRTLTVDLLGSHGGPAANCGFGLADAAAEGFEPEVGDFVLGAGRYYVDGLLVENEMATAYSTQSDLPSPLKLSAGKTYLAYLDVWERHITYLEDDGIRETALGGPDTCTRVKTICQVKVAQPGGEEEAESATAEELQQQLEEVSAKLQEARAALEEETNATKQAALKRSIKRLEKQSADLKERLDRLETAEEPALGAGECGELLEPLNEWASGVMAARLEAFEPSETPCILPPESRYRGLENHLYRIEIHASGDAGDPNNIPTFKWSRENGSIATRWLGTKGNEVTVSNTRGFAAGQWAEFTTETDDLLGRPGPLVRITRVEGNVLTLENAPSWKSTMIRPKVRQWDQSANDELQLQDGAVPITAGAGEQGWIEIEDGIEIQFSTGPYRSGDYWLIPARVATGAIEWPSGADDSPLAIPPSGITHHYAPLFMVKATGTAPFVSLVKDCRCRFAPLPCLEE